MSVIRWIREGDEIDDDLEVYIMLAREQRAIGAGTNCEEWFLLHLGPRVDDEAGDAA